MERFIGASLYKITTTNLPLWGDHMMLNESQKPYLLLATNLMANNQLPDPSNEGAMMIMAPSFEGYYAPANGAVAW